MGISPNVWVGIGEGLKAGQRTYAQVLEAERLQQERDAERQLRAAEARRREEMDRLERRRIEMALERQPLLDARSDLETNLKVKGLEATLNDPATLELAQRAGVTFDTRPVFKPEWATGATHATGEEITPEMVTAQQNRGIFEKTGIVKPPEVQEKEAERRLAIQRAQQVSSILQSLGGGAPGTGGLDDSPAGRMRLKLGLGINGNDLFGPVRETPEQSAAKAAADAKARLPFQKELIEHAAKQRGVDAGDPYFNTALQIISSILPPLTPESAGRAVEMAAELARQAQARVPRGKAESLKPAPAPGGETPPAGAPPSMDALIQQAVGHFGSLDKAIVESQKPVVQAGLKAAGIDPAAYLRRMQAMQILEALQAVKK